MGLEGTAPSRAAGAKQSLAKFGLACVSPTSPPSTGPRPCGFTFPLVTTQGGRIRGSWGHLLCSDSQIRCGSWAQVQQFTGLSVIHPPDTISQPPYRPPPSLPCPSSMLAAGVTSLNTPGFPSQCSRSLWTNPIGLLTGTLPSPPAAPSGGPAHPPSTSLLLPVELTPLPGTLLHTASLGMPGAQLLTTQDSAQMGTVLLTIPASS